MIRDIRVVCYISLIADQRLQKDYCSQASVSRLLSAYPKWKKQVQTVSAVLKLQSAPQCRQRSLDQSLDEEASRDLALGMDY